MIVNEDDLKYILIINSHPDEIMPIIPLCGRPDISELLYSFSRFCLWYRCLELESFWVVQQLWDSILWSQYLPVWPEAEEIIRKDVYYKN